MRRGLLALLLALVVSGPAWAATVITALPNQTYPAGTRTFGPVAIPTGLTVVTVAISRASLSPTVRLDWALELSQDGGTTWLPWGGAGTVGGDVINPSTGLPLTDSSFAVFLPNPANPLRRARGSLTLSEPTRLSLTITVS